MSSHASRWALWRGGSGLAVALAAAAAVSTGAACERRPRSAPLSVGQAVEGRLEPGDWTDVFADGSYTDLFEVDLAAGQTVTIELSSPEMDTYLSLMRGPGDQIQDNDDISPDDRNSRIVYTSPDARRYFVAATTYQAGGTGAYRLTVREGGRPDENTEPPRPASSAKTAD